MKVKFQEWNCIVEKAFYFNNRVALELIHEETGDSIAIATVNIPDYKLPKGCVLIKDWSENEGMHAALVEAGVVGPQIALIPTGFVDAILCKLLI